MTKYFKTPDECLREIERQISNGARFPRRPYPKLGKYGWHISTALPPKPKKNTPREDFPKW